MTEGDDVEKLYGIINSNYIAFFLMEFKDVYANSRHGISGISKGIICSAGCWLCS